jgi:hypothetical protein
MKAILALIAGVLSLLAPIWFLSGFVPVPEYRTGTLSDYRTVIGAAVTLYGGVFAGIILGRRLAANPVRDGSARGMFFAGMVGAMIAITLAIIAAFLADWISTGRIMRPGQTPALLPVVYIVSGIISAFIAAGAVLISYALTPKAESR